MAISNAYPTGIPVADADLFVGTKAYTNRTVNYTAQGIADYLNINAKVSIGGQMSFRFSITPDISKTISFEGGLGNNTPFADITRLVTSGSDASGSDITIFLNYLIDTQILLAQQNQPNNFGHYKITGYSQIDITDFYNLDLEYIGGNGNIVDDTYYDLVSFNLSGGVGTIPTLQEISTANGNILYAQSPNGNSYFDTNLNDVDQSFRAVIGDSAVQSNIILYAGESSYLSIANTDTINLKGILLKDALIELTNFKLSTSKQNKLLIPESDNNTDFSLPSDKATGSYTLATTDDIGTTPTLQEVTDVGNTTTNTLEHNNGSNLKATLSNDGSVALLSFYDSTYFASAAQGVYAGFGFELGDEYGQAAGISALAQYGAGFIGFKFSRELSQAIIMLQANYGDIITDSISLYLPKGSPTVASEVIPISVNGNFADDYGNISITGGATDLGYTPSPTNGIVTSSTGTDATLPLANATDAGLLQPADFTQLSTLATDLANKVDKNTAITGATKTKITYDVKGLVTSGADATTADIADSTDKRYQTDNQNTRNDATSSIQTQLNGKQASLGFTAENVANKSTDVNTDQASSTKYPTVKSVYDWATGLFATITNLALKSNIASPTFTGTVTTPAIIISSETASRVAIFDASKNVISADTVTYPSLTELARVKGLTSSVQTQLDLRTRELLQDFTDYTTTGVLTEQIISNQAITANDMKINSWLNFISTFSRTGTTNATVAIYLNTTSNSLSGAVKIGTATITSTQSLPCFKRDYSINASSVLRGLLFTANAVTDEIATQAQSTTTLTLGSAYYLISTVTLNNVADTVTQRAINLKSSK